MHLLAATPEPVVTVNWITVVLSFFGGGLIGSIISVTASHCLTAKRDKLNRLNHFRGQLARWRCHFYRENDAVAYYRNNAGDIAYECGVFAPDRQDLKTALWQLYSFHGHELEQNGKEKLIHHIESIMTILGAHPTA